MTTFMTVSSTKKDVLRAAEWIIKEGESRLGREFVLWNAASQEEAYCISQTFPEGSESEWDYWESQIEDIPRPPKMGIRIVGRHNLVQIEDIFHYSVIYDDRWELSSQGNVVRYNLALALLRLIRQVGHVAVIEILDWDSMNLYQQLMDEVTIAPRPTRRRRRS